MLSRVAISPGMLGLATVLTLSLEIHAASNAEQNLPLGDVPSEYDIRGWHREHGLPSDYVIAQLQTRDGYLWIGTRAGLARYDGVRFVVFNRDNTAQMANEVCQALAEDTEGVLWVGTENGLLRRQSATWTRYGVQDGLPATNVWAVCTTRDGTVWIGTGQGLARFEQGKFAALTGTNGLGRCKIMALHEDADGTLWIGTSRGMFHWNLRNDAFEKDLQPPTGATPYVSGIFRDLARRLWVASNTNEEFFCFLHFWDGEKWTQVFGPNFSGHVTVVRQVAELDGTVWIPTCGAGLSRELHGVAARLPFREISGTGQTPTALAVDREANVWVGMFKGGLFRVTPQRLRVLGADDGLPHDVTWTVCESQDGSVWIGTDGGVSQFKDGHFSHYSQTNGLSRNEVRAVAETTDGTMWVGTLNGLDSIRDGQVSHVRFPGQWVETKVRALLAARNGALWVGTVRGLTRLHNGERTQYTPANGLGAEEVRALLEDRTGNLWVGTFGGGLTQFVVPPSGGEQDANGRGTFNAPNRLKPELRTLTMTNGLSSVNVWALHEDAAGVLWIGTDRGLNRLKDGKIKVFTTREGLPDDLVNVIAEDDFGRLWIGHDRGIYWVAKQDFEAVATGRARSVTAVNYDETDGLRSREVNGQKSFPAACKTRDGRLWIATARGVAVINPAKVSVDATPPGAIIEEIRANSETVFDNISPAPKALSDRSGDSGERRHSLNWGGSDVRRSAETPLRGSSTSLSDFGIRTSGLRLLPGRGRVLEFRYTAGAFVAPEKVRFRYRMTGLSPNWIDVGTRREVFFTDLRPGDYEFELIAANHHGVWPERGTRMRVHLAPHLYETAWFWPGVVVLAITAVGLVSVWRIRDLRQRHALERQAALARERDRIARDMHDDLGAGLTRLVLTGGRVAASSADAETRTAVERLSGEAAGLLDQLGDLVWCTNHQFDTLDSLLARLREHAATFLEEAGLNVRFDLPQTVPALAITGEFRRQVFLLFKEVLTNIARHAQARTVRICIRLGEPSRGESSPRDSRLEPLNLAGTRSAASPSFQPEIGDADGTRPYQREREAHGEVITLGLEVADDGRGFDLATAQQASGNGLKNLRVRVAGLSGRLNLQSSPSHGTTVRIQLPLQPHVISEGGQNAKPA